MSSRPTAEPAQLLSLVPSSPCALPSKRSKEKTHQKNPIKDFVAATSVGIFDKQHILDLNYDEDSTASVDFNVVKTGKGGFVEIQGTAERDPFNDKDLQNLLGLANKGIKELIALQKKAIGKMD